MAAPLPIACTLTPDALSARKAALLPGLVRRATAREGEGDTVRLQFDATAFTDLMTTIDAERQCCRFLRFDVTVAPDGGPIQLTLSGPPGTGDFLQALFDL
ncbi:MAG: hypothetical protein Q8L86_08540 [Vicinamibacterales bacterium]|nr:hypothetical protein [Vicinamibacterales bacterium]